MATLNSIATHKLSPFTIRKPTENNFYPILFSINTCTLPQKLNASKNSTLLFSKARRRWVICSVTEDKEVVPVKNKQFSDKDNRLVNGSENFEPVSSGEKEEEEVDVNDRLIGKAVNATIVLGAGTYAVTKLLTIDHDYWHGWTLYEVLRYAPEHNWVAYEEALKANPVLAKMAISGIVYSIGDWIAQCYEGKPLFDFDLKRMFRSGLVGFTLHGSLSHYYYQFCEALFPFEDWWVVPAKVVFDQTVWAAVWNSIYFVFLGFLRLESPTNILSELKATFWPLLTAGWKLWPFAHVITYSVIPVEQRLLWVDCVELIWVTILSTYSNEKSEARISESASEVDSNSSSGSLEKLISAAELIFGATYMGLLNDENVNICSRAHIWCQRINYMGSCLVEKDVRIAVKCKESRWGDLHGQSVFIPFCNIKACHWRYSHGRNLKIIVRSSDSA
ncbi:hypothetical protein Pint_02197 [Pistacia integerrima]|uniref:Uncharacterized protein n=1 Tax=Pistacia integerrima TaxID=434235 RepID=A0ACC0ZNB9_9ROSI|nr:hypothetical protein Pint_02197 [Pistacia integerrima]